jgi:nucleoside-diphosphate-sugar epimerase
LIWRIGRGWKALSQQRLRSRGSSGCASRRARSITNPDEYVASNLVGFVNVLEGVRACSCRHFVFASSSSVYGSNNKMPFAEEDSTDFPVSLYAATKKSNEVLAHAYSHLFRIPTTGFDFSPSTAHGGVRIWRSSNLLTRS